METLELKTTITEIKNLMVRANRLEMTERVTKLKNRSMKITKSEHQRQKLLKQNKQTKTEPQRPIVGTISRVPTL